jgi:uncharacterized membrane protein (DUF485 family)
MNAPLIAPLPAALPERPNRPDAVDRPSWSAAVASEPFAALLATKVRCIAPLLTVSFVFIVAMTLLAGYAKEFMAQKVLGSFNVGYLMIVLTYLLCWVVSLIYVYTANRKFDSQAVIAIAALKPGRLT